MESVNEHEDADNRQVNFPRRLRSDDPFYRAVNPINIDGGELTSSAFANTSKTDSMSVDWAQESTYQETFNRWNYGAGQAVVSITAELCWDGAQILEFTPDKINPSHSDVIGKKSKAFRRFLTKNAVPLIRGDLIDPTAD